MLTWAFNTSRENVFNSAQAKAALISNGAPSVQFDIYSNKELGGMGMAWWSQENLSRFQSFVPLRPLPSSPIPYTFPPRPAQPIFAPGRDYEIGGP
jgi:hypothetical protein